MRVPLNSGSEQITDGRRRKGERRRHSLIRATLRVIEREGIAALSQRVVAREAELPPSAVTYYFPTIDELLVATISSVNDSYIAQITSFSADNDHALEELALLIESSTGEYRPYLAAEYELCLLAARRADMQGELARWNRTVDAFVARYLADPAERAGFAAAIDGLFLRSFSARHPPSASQLHDVLRRLARRS